jgi:hypothetical protein
MTKGIITMTTGVLLTKADAPMVSTSNSGSIKAERCRAPARMRRISRCNMPVRTRAPLSTNMAAMVTGALLANTASMSSVRNSPSTIRAAVAPTATTSGG